LTSNKYCEAELSMNPNFMIKKKKLPSPTWRMLSFNYAVMTD
jgi:hypothetical protein